MNEQQINEYLNFLNEVLWVTSNSKADPKIVYSVLKANLNKLDNNFLRVLQAAATATLAQADLEQKQRIAGAIVAFSNLIAQFPLGSQLINIEIAIVGYKSAGTVFTRNLFPKEWSTIQMNLGISYGIRLCQGSTENLEQAIRYFNLAFEECARERFPDDWAMLQMNLGNAYSRRIWGKRAENLEQAISCYNMALEECSRDQFPERWVMLQNVIANAYRDRIEGERVENLEQAISCYNMALEKCPRDQFPEQWALLLYNLGIAYQDRIKDERAENLEVAIAAHQAALEVYTSEAFPQKWAMVQLSLGNAFLLRIRGNRAENIEEAITSFQLAIQVYTLAEFPSDWAATIASLGTAYYLRIKGDVVNNCEEAISYYNLALQIYTREEFPADWAKAQLNLGNAYSNRNLGNRDDNLKLAIAAYELALQVYTCEAFPQEWAMTQSNLGSVCSHLQTERAENIERAIACYQNALQIRTQEAFPQEWAETQINLASAYGQRLQGEKAANLKIAIACCHNAMIVCSREAFPQQWALIYNGLGNAYKELQQIPEAIESFQLALEIFTPTAFPMDCIRVGRLLGDAAFTDGRWDEAIKGYAAAIDAVEQSRSWMTADLHRQAIQETFLHLYENIVQVCIKAKKLDRAIEYVERSRSKRLVDLMASNAHYSNVEIRPEVQQLLQEYDAVQQQINEIRFNRNSNDDRELIGVRIDSGERIALKVNNETVASLVNQQQQVWDAIRQFDPVLAAGKQVSRIDFAAMQELIDEPTTAILSFYTTAQNTYIFVLRKDRVTPYLHTCVGEGMERLQNWLFQNWLRLYGEDRKTWESQISTFLVELAGRLQIKVLVDQHLNGIKDLILVPHLDLHLVPFAALPIRDNQFLGDKFQIRYVPSCQVLQFCWERQKHTPVGDSLAYGIVEDATEDLPFASFEGEQITRMHNIPEALRLQGHKQATVEKYRELANKVQVIHSSHHAEYCVYAPLQSALKLGNGFITLGELLTPRWRLPHLEEVFLACCETNLGIAQKTDDILTLSFGFLCAGAKSVVSTLWSVNDLATALFSIFYYQHRKQGYNRPEAVRRSQVDIRTLTGETVAITYKPQIEPLLNLKLKQADEAFKKAYQAWKDARKKQQEHPQESQKCAAFVIHTRKIKEKLEAAQDKLSSCCEQEFPFADPFYWAAFTCSGLR